MRTMALTVALLALVGFARGDETDPEPPGSGGPEVRKLQGTWKMDRLILKGKTPKGPAQTTYTFKGDKVTVDTGKLKYTAKVKLDTKNRPFTMELIREDIKSTRKMGFKVEKGELFFAIPAGKGGQGEIADDFSGEKNPVMVFTKEEKK
jgi:uncharacterized protein (TIGR03067 family)